MLKIKKAITRYALIISWLQALVATVVSLYYSEIKDFAPCTLCWYQRIFMYPLVILLAIAILRKDNKIHYYALPLSLGGLILALYHTLLQTNLIPQSTAPCTIGVSCTTKYIDYFGFLSIPLLSFLAFAVITGSMLFLIYNPENHKK